MKIEFVGAARTVTGSSYIVKNDDFTVMVDCGMFQGRRDLKDRNFLHLIYAPEEIDAVLVTHAHIDHSGLIPKLVKEGYKGPIFATPPTVDLLKIMLPDSAHIQEMDSEWINRRNKKLGREEIKPLYDEQDALESLKFLEARPYGQEFEVVPGVKACFRDAGHILGSSFIEMKVEEKEKTTKIVFSGDLGPRDQAIIRNAETVKDADILLIESTYGDRLHKSKKDTYAEFRDVINRTYNGKGNIVIPSFAVERTQEIIYTLSRLLKDESIPPISVYIDSPLAIQATEVFRKHPECFDDDTRAIIEAGESPLDFPGLHFTRTTEESKDLNKKARGSIIISASGMCTAGRIKFHLQNNLYKKDSSIIFVGYQAEGTLGRTLVDGAKRVKIYGEDVVVNAPVYTLGGFSGHADRDGLLEWMSSISNPNLKVFVVHGEEKAAENFAELVHERYGYQVSVPAWGDIVDLESMQVERADYGAIITEEVEETVEVALSEVREILDEFIQKYKKAKRRGRLGEIRILKDDIDDLKASIHHITDRIG